VRDQELLDLVEPDLLHDRLLDPNTAHHRVAFCTTFSVRWFLFFDSSET
jgi:hypothetical protein